MYDIRKASMMHEIGEYIGWWMLDFISSRVRTYILIDTYH